MYMACEASWFSSWRVGKCRKWRRYRTNKFTDKITMMINFIIAVFHAWNFWNKTWIGQNFEENLILFLQQNHSISKEFWARSSHSEWIHKNMIKYIIQNGVIHYYVRNFDKWKTWNFVFPFAHYLMRSKHENFMKMYSKLWLTLSEFQHQQ